VIDFEQGGKKQSDPTVTLPGDFAHGRRKTYISQREFAREKKWLGTEIA
jgi:hypothetical protein